jgi:hypothetical protein
LSNKFTSFSEIIKKAKQIQEAKLVEHGVFNNLNAPVTIFVLKNHHGYRDKQDIEHSGEINALPKLSKEQIDKIVDKL